MANDRRNITKQQMIEATAFERVLGEVLEVAH
jgi:hypothetical protein